MAEDNKKYVVHGMRAECSMGTMKNYLNTDVGHGVLYQGQPLLNANDHIPQINLTHFGDCASSMSKCQPVTLLPWIDCNDKHMLDGAPALTIDSMCTCMLGGVIKIIEQTEESNIEIDEEETVESNMDADKEVQAKDLQKFITNSTLDFSPVTTDKTKQETLKSVYYILKKNGFSDVIIAGIMGNILCEGTIGQFERIPYGAHTRKDEDGNVKEVHYYRNSWQNPDVYTQFPHRQDTNPTNDGKSDAHEYANSYSNKVAYRIKNFTIGELKQMLSIRISGKYGSSIFGYGPIQATSDTWHDRYLNAIAQLGFTDDTLITKEVAFLIDATLNLNAAKLKCPNNTLPYVGSDGSYKEPRNMSNNKNTFDAVINGVQVNDPTLQEVCRFSAYWTTQVEACAGYGDINTIVKRAKASVQCYQQLQAWENEAANE